jgi:hypothetical protein
VDLSERRERVGDRPAGAAQAPEQRRAGALARAAPSERAARDAGDGVCRRGCGSGGVARGAGARAWEEARRSAGGARGSRRGCASGRGSSGAGAGGLERAGGAADAVQAQERSAGGKRVGAGPAALERVRSWRRACAGACEQLWHTGGAGARGRTRLGRARMELRHGSSGQTSGGSEAVRGGDQVVAGAGHGGDNAIVRRLRSGGA